MGVHFFRKKVLPLALTASMMLSATPVLAASSDLDGHWAKNVITEWQDKGLIKGYSDGTFKPNNSITRAEFIVLMNNAQGFSADTAISFSDVAESDWYYGAVAKAVKAGYTKGYEDGTFKPNQTITRAEAAVMIANAMGLSADESGASFTDAAAIPAWAKGSIGAAAAAGYLSGYPDGSFGATKSITRAEAVSSLNRTLGSAAAVVEEEPAAETPEAKDVVIDKAGTKLEDEKISGNLIIDKAVGDGEVYLNDVEVDGDLIVKGGGKNSVYLNGSSIGGRIMMQKNGVHVHIAGKSSISAIDMPLPGRITFAKDFDGSVKSVNIPENAEKGDYVIESESKDITPVKELNLDAAVTLTLDANVTDASVGENAENSKITIKENATVSSFEIDAKVDLNGNGSVENIVVSESGVKINGNLDTGNITTENGASAPTTTTTTTGSGSSSSSSSSGGSSSGGSSSGGSGSSSAPTTQYVTLDKAEAKLNLTRNANAATAGLVSFIVENATEIDGSKINAPTLSSTNGTLTLNVNVLGNQNKIEVSADGVPDTAGTYTATLTIPANAITPESSYTAKELTATITVEVKEGAASSTPVAVTVTETEKVVNGNDDKEVKLTLSKTDLTLDTDYTVTVSKDSSPLTNGTNYQISVTSGVITITFKDNVIVNGSEYKVTVATKDATKYTFTGGEVTLTNSTPASTKDQVEFKTGSPVSIQSGGTFEGSSTFSATVTGAKIDADQIVGSWKKGGVATDETPFTATHAFDAASSLNVTFNGTAPTVTAETTYTYVIKIPKAAFSEVQEAYYYVPEDGMTIDFIDITVTVPESSGSGD